MRRFLLPLFIFVLAIGACLFYWHFYTPQELTFSDGAHYAVAARELVVNHSWTSKFSFFGPSVFWHLSYGDPLYASFLPLTSLSISLSFLILGISDFSAVLPSMIFFGLTAVVIFLLTHRHLKIIPSLLASLIFVLFVPFLDYATSAATEPLFTFLLVLAFYLLDSQSRILRVIGWLPVVLTFFSRPHAFFYLPGYVLLFVFQFPANIRRKIIGYTVVVGLVAVPLLIMFGGNLPFARYFAFNQSQVLLANSPLMPANTSLRAEHKLFDITALNSLKVITVKVFYDTYNLIKLLPQIFPPYLIPFVLIGLFIADVPVSIKLFFGSSFLINLLVIAASVPSFRYLHPLLPFAIVLGVWSFSVISHKINLKGVSFVLISALLFLVIPLSSLILDARYISNTHHVGKPSALKLLGSKLGGLTPPGSNTVTNLDVWGSWYGDRTTVWFPLVPEQIESAVKDLPRNPIDYIYITSYRANDENLLVGPEWQSLLKDQPTISNEYLKRAYEIDQVVTIKADDNYDNLPLKAVLLKKIR